MIVPLANQSEWASVLGGLPCMKLPGGSVVVVAPHPDDETLATGGLIAALRAQHREVTVVAVTDGENAYANEAGLGALRREEQTAALLRLGVPEAKILRLGLPDSDVASREGELTERLVSLLTPETCLIAPWQGDFHPDHEACGRAAEEAARRSDSPLLSYLFWTWHRSSPALLGGLPLTRLALDPGSQAAKAEALLQHRSQLAHPSGEPILPERLLWPARLPCEVFLIP